MEKKIGLAANVAIILVAIAIVCTLVQRRSQFKNVGPDPRVDPVTLIGHQFPIQSNWTGEHKNVVLALQVGCHFCEASAPFYKKLASYAASRHVGILAVLPQTVSVDQAYIKDLGIEGAQVKSSALTTIAVGGTPTLFVLNDKGVVEQVWQGQLQEGDESKVLQAIN